MYITVDVWMKGCNNDGEYEYELEELFSK